MDFKDKKIWFPVAIGAIVICVFMLIIFAFSSKKGTKQSVSDKTKKETTATKAPTPTPTANVETTEVEKDAHEEVNNIVKQYFQYSLKGDADSLDKIVSDAEQVTKEELQRKYEYIEGVKNIECYTLPGPDENSYVVYVYYEYKFVNIDTLAPGMSRYYVCAGSDGSLKLLLNQVDDVVKDVLQRSEQNPNIISLKATVQKKYEEALTKDTKLKEFVDTINKTSQQAAATATPKATAKPKKK
ncbi:hypothetical protein lbkm_1862 [Lachnospiraceae bacterium KM106-2]|nr:hypothetical protein lbkm_1862 [Lachnospiraceae bacterium KM106-2]